MQKTNDSVYIFGGSKEKLLGDGMAFLHVFILTNF